MNKLGWRDIERLAAANLGVIQIGIGTSIVAGGSERFPPPTYSALLDVTRGEAWPYGLPLVVAGVLLVSPFSKAAATGHVLAVVLMNFMAGLFLVSLAEEPAASALTWWMFFSLGTLHGFNLALMYVRRRDHLYEGGQHAERTA